MTTSPTALPPGRVLVTGPAGRTVHAVLDAIRSQGRSAQAIVDAPTAVDLADVVVVDDRRDAPLLIDMLAGATSALLISRADSDDEAAIVQATVRACTQAGVNRLVYQSVLHPRLDAMTHDEGKSEAEIAVMTSGLDWTIIRPNIYLQDLASAATDLQAGRYVVPYAPEQAVSYVDLRDVAEITATATLARSWVHSYLQLSGPQPLAADDIARCASRVLARPVQVERCDVAAWIGRFDGLSAQAAAYLGAVAAHVDRFGLHGDSTVLRMLLGHRPRDAESYLRELLT